MDPGRYALQQGWDTNSALEGYGPAHEPDFRPGGSGGRRVPNERFSRESIYSRNAFSGDMLDREIYPPVPVSSMWPQSRRRNFNDEDSLSKDSRRPSSFHDIDDFHDPKKYHEIDSFHEVDRFHDRYRLVDSYHDPDGYRDYMFERHAKTGTRDHDDVGDHYDLRHRGSYESRENSRERDYDTGRYDYESDQDKGRRESSWRRHDSREQDREKRSLSWERGQSPYARHYDSRSRGRDDRSRSRSPRARNGGRSYREDIYDDKRYERFENRWDYDEKHYHSSSVTPSATVVVKGLSLKTTEEDLYQMLAEWGPLRHVRVIKERNSGISRGFAFIDFPSVEAACSMMDGIGENGLTIDGKKLFFEYSSKPTGGAGAGAPALRHEGIGKSGFGYGRSAPPSDWICTICGCVNFARRTSCFQCNEPRTDDAPSADVTPPTLLGRKGSDAGPTHVLVVRGLDDNADEEMLRYEFSKHAPIKDLRLVRDKFTHVSRGFAFLHFHSVEDATKALEATNGMTLEKNGQILRVAYAKSIHGPTGAPQSSSLAAAAIEAATFAQQYDSVGWTPKEYNPDDKQSTAAPEQNGKTESQVGGSAPQAGFIWDEKSGYYYDATSGFYYDGNTGLYYDGNNGIWYSYDHQSQQYVPCASQGDTKASEELTSDGAKASTNNNTKKVVISAPASTIKLNESTSLPDAVQAAASAALAAEKKEKEKQKEIKLASKNNLLASKKKMNNVLALWKQRNNEGQAARVVLDDNEQSGLTDDKQNISYSGKNKVKASAASVKESSNSSGFAIESQVKPRPVTNSSGGTIMGVIRGSGRGVIRADTTFSGSSSLGAATASLASTSSERIPLGNSEPTCTVTPFKTDASALSSCTPTQPVAAGSGKRRFSETPVQAIVPQTAYRDRAAERRSRYGSSFNDDLSDDLVDSNCDYPSRKGHLPDMSTMPFPPGVGGGRSSGDLPNYEVITADRAIDEKNVGNRMLRSMGWQDGLGLGKDGSGIKEPVQARAVEDRSGLGSRQRRAVDNDLEALPGDSYKTIIQKKAIARFREMS